MALSGECYQVGGIFNAISRESNKVQKDLDDDGLFSNYQKPVEKFVVVKENRAMKKKKAALVEKITEEEILKLDEDIDDDSEVEDLLAVKQSRIPTPEPEEEPKGKKKKKNRSFEDPERLERTIFVGNVSTQLNRKDIRKLFSPDGPIETVRIRSVPAANPKQSKKEALIKKDFHPERGSMNAYVVFKDKESVAKAFKKNGTKIKDMHIRVDVAAASGEKVQHDHKLSLFVGNLPYAAKEDELRGHFSQCGSIKGVRLIRDQASGMGKGFGYVTFEERSAVLLGLKMNGSTFSGRKLRVQSSTADPKSGNKNNGNKNNEPKRKSFGGTRSTSKKDVRRLTPAERRIQGKANRSNKTKKGKKK